MPKTVVADSNATVPQNKTQTQNCSISSQTQVNKLSATIAPQSKARKSSIITYIQETELLLVLLLHPN